MSKIGDSLSKDVISRIVSKFIEKSNPNSRSPIAFTLGDIDYIGDDKVGDHVFDMDYNQNIYEKGSGGLITCSFKTNMEDFGDNFIPIPTFQFIIIFYSEYITEYRNYNISSVGVTLSDKVRNSINDYLEFNSDLFFAPGSLVRIFGGAVRDSIGDREINDVDILVGSRSIKFVNNILIDNGYKYMESLAPKDLSRVYKDLSIINEPHTWMKGSKIVQLIRPATGYIGNDMIPDEREKIYKKSFSELVSNVDISCCGISYSLDNLYEDYPNAILHAQTGNFYVNSKAKMYSSDRIVHRIDKLEKRGWIRLDHNDVSVNRDLKIDVIL